MYNIQNYDKEKKKRETKYLFYPMLWSGGSKIIRESSLFSPLVLLLLQQCQLFQNDQTPFLKLNTYRQPTEYPHLFCLFETKHVFKNEGQITLM
jgi:hypothetical protein